MSTEQAKLAASPEFSQPGFAVWHKGKESPFWHDCPRDQLKKEFLQHVKSFGHGIPIADMTVKYGTGWDGSSVLNEEPIDLKALLG